MMSSTPPLVGLFVAGLCKTQLNGIPQNLEGLDMDMDTHKILAQIQTKGRIG